MTLSISTRFAALGLLAAVAATASCAGNPGPARPIPARADEPRLRNVRQLTFGGENAEAYFSYDGARLIFQATHPGAHPCDQQYTMNTRGGDVRLISGGTGRTTCGYYFPGRQRVLYSSTFATDTACPPRPDFSKGYVWALYDYQVYTADADGGNLRRLTHTPGYNAEATLSPDGRTIVFTSIRGGDLDIYTMDADGGNVRQLTHELGYDGGPFFSPDGRHIVYRANHPSTEREQADYRGLLAEKLVRPTTLEIWVMDADGSNKRQVTNLNAASFAPFYLPDGKRIIFSSNHGDPRGREFDLFLVNDDGTGLERVTHSPEFDGFPMFSPDGRSLVFGSNRNAAHRGDTNIFMADWVDAPAPASGGGR
jgi:Tol biopolymer transport system component